MFSSVPTISFTISSMEKFRATIIHVSTDFSEGGLIADSAHSRISLSYKYLASVFANCLQFKQHGSDLERIIKVLYALANLHSFASSSHDMHSINSFSSSSVGVTSIHSSRLSFVIFCCLRFSLACSLNNRCLPSRLRKDQSKCGRSCRSISSTGK